MAIVVIIVLPYGPPALFIALSEPLNSFFVELLIYNGAERAFLSATSLKAHSVINGNKFKFTRRSEAERSGRNSYSKRKQFPDIRLRKFKNNIWHIESWERGKEEIHKALQYRSRKFDLDDRGYTSLTATAWVEKVILEFQIRSTFYHKYCICLTRSSPPRCRLTIKKSDIEIWNPCLQKKKTNFHFAHLLEDTAKIFRNFVFSSICEYIFYKKI